MVAEVILAPNPGPQTLALSCPVPDLLYGGARGGGKSIFLILDWLAHAQRNGGRARGLVLRRTREQLRDFQEECRKYLGKLQWEWAEQKHTWRGPDGSVLSLAYLERDEDAEHYQGWNLSYLAIDEAGNFQTPTPIDRLRACLRSPGCDHLLRLTANPGGPGHAWLKERYVDPARPLTPHISAEGIERVYIPAKIRDNPHVDTPEYRASLAASGPAWLVKAWLDGDWDVVAGGGFFDVEKIKASQPAPTLPRVYLGIDPALTAKERGTGDYTALAIVAQDGPRWWILYVERERWSADQAVAAIIRLARQWQPATIFCEGGPAGLAFIPWLKKFMEQSGEIYHLVTVSHAGDKASKAVAFQAACESGAIHVPAGAPWWKCLRDEMLVFTGDGKLHDDQVDAVGMVFREVRRTLGQAAAEVIKPPPPEGSHAWWEQRRPQRIMDEPGSVRRMIGGGDDDEPQGWRR